jgi:hypothetical protein
MSFQFLVCQLTCDFFLHKSQYVSISRMCVSIDVHFFLCKFLRVKREKLAKTLSNIYTAGKDPSVWEFLFGFISPTSQYHGRHCVQLSWRNHCLFVCLCAISNTFSDPGDLKKGASPGISCWRIAYLPYLRE